MAEASTWPANIFRGKITEILRLENGKIVPCLPLGPGSPPLPGTKVFGRTNSDPESVERRRVELEKYLRCGVPKKVSEV